MRCFVALFLTLIAVQAQAANRFADLPLSFEENRGQASSDAGYVARGDGYGILLGEAHTQILLRSFGISFQFVGAKRAAILGEQRLDGVVNYLTARKTVAGVPTFARVRQRSIYSGIDVVYYGKQHQLEYDFIVQPGSDPKKIAIAFDGAERLSIDKDGNLHIGHRGREIVQHKPHVYQGDRSVAGEYRLLNSTTVGFQIGPYDHHQVLVIDPILSYSTFLGGSDGDENARGIATDSTGNVYLTGSTTSTNFQTVGAVQGTAGSADPDLGLSDTFITKLNPAGTALLYSTYIGGSGDDDPVGIVLDASNNVVVAGTTTSTDLPTTSSALRRTCNIDASGSCADAFVLKLNATGSAFVFSTYLGGTDDEEMRGLAIDSAGNICVAGKTASKDFPLTANAAQTSSQSGFISRLSATGALTYSTYYEPFAGGGTEVRAIALDNAGNVYITGSIQSTLFGNDVFVIKQSATSGARSYTSIFQGMTDESSNAIVVDAAGNAYVTGATASHNLLSGTIQKYLSGGLAFKTSDAGASWNPVGITVPRSSVYALAVTSSAPSTIYAGTDDERVGGVYRSGNSGASWNIAGTPSGPSGDINMRVHALAIDPQNVTTIYAGARNTGVYKSTDGGTTWSATSLTNVFVTALAIDPLTPATIYAGTDGDGVYKSVNGGSTWTAINNGLFNADVRTLAIHPSTPATLFVGTSSGLYKTVDGGANWTLSSSGLLDPNINAILIDPRNPAQMYVGTNTIGLFRSLNSGSFWLAANSGLSGSSVTALALDPTAGTFYAAAGESNAFRIYKSANGISWTPTDLATTRTTAIAVDRTVANTIYVTTLGGTDAFVLKLDSAGSLVYSTYLGGYRDDAGNSIAVDSAGNAYITGSTSSTNFPVVSGVQPGFGGGREVVTDAFVAKLNAAGSAIAYSTYLGGTSNDFGNAITVDSSGAVYVAGQSGSSDFPTASPLGAKPGLLDAFIAKITESNTAPYSVATRGGYTASSQGTGTSVTAGYGRITPAAGSTAPQGLAIFDVRLNNTLVSEAAVPASTLISSGRIYAEAGGQVRTGLAIANPNSQPVSISFYVTNNAGGTVEGAATVDANGQIARFLDQSPFNIGANVSGTFTFTASAPVAVVALRGLMNERGDFLITTLPVVDLSVAPASGEILFPHYADGGGWSTQVILVNPTDSAMSGVMTFYSQSGQAGLATAYSIPARGSFRYATAGTAAATQSGSIRVTPSANNPAPSGVAIFALRANGITVSEAGVPALRTGAAFRLYAESSGFFNTSQIGSMQTGIAIANPSASTVTVNFELSLLNGASTGLTGSLTLDGNGQKSMFIDKIPGFTSLPNPLQGVLRISTTSPAGIAVVGLRGRYNERNDFLMTTTQPTDESAPAFTSEQFFPHIADGGGYTTQFVLFNGGADRSSTGTLRFYTQAGQTLSLTIR